MNRKPLWILLSVLSLSACKEKEKAAEPPPLPSVAAPAAAPTPPPAATTAAPAATAPAAVGLPTSEDYEQQAIDQINPQNMDSELDKLEKDIGP
jgi:hypothetical protein